MSIRISSLVNHRLGIISIFCLHLQQNMLKTVWMFFWDSLSFITLTDLTSVLPVILPLNQWDLHWVTLLGEAGVPPNLYVTSKDNSASLQQRIIQSKWQSAGTDENCSPRMVWYSFFFFFFPYFTCLQSKTRSPRLVVLQGSVRLDPT